MLSRTFEYVKSLVATLRPADLLDVVIVSMLVYTAIAWLRTARSRFVLGGVAALLGLYLLARILEMRLTLFLFQVGVTVALVAVVVIFQEEIRRTFERIATGGWLGRRRARPVADEVVDTIVAAARGLARQHTGALIVFRGREPLERHITAGIPLGGRVSEPLIYSIFDTSSPGHDGALLIEDGLVSRFAVHLPLSTAVKSSAHFGTRHTAALGLSERSDALVVVVSEERGTVSVAQNGELVTLPSAAQLRARASAFLARVAPEPRSPWYRRVFAHHLISKALSIVIASAAWLVIYGYESETYTRTFTVPIAYVKSPPGLWLEAPSPVEVRVSLHGTSGSFQELDPRQLTVELDVSGVHAGTQHVSIRDADLELPNHLSIRAIEPRSIAVNASKTVTISVPVKPQFVGQMPAGLVLQSCATRPANVSVVVRQAERSRFTGLRTEPVELDHVHATTTLTRRLLLPTEAQLESRQPEEVELDIAVAPR